MQMKGEVGLRADELKHKLLTLSEDSYKDFNKKLLPGIENILGVRLPIMRDIAKDIAKNDFREYLESAKDDTYEEVMIQGLVIGYAKVNIEEKFIYLDKFVPKIDNWGVCDSCSMTYKFMKKNKEESWEYLQKYYNSSREFEIRFAVVCTLAHFIDEEYIEIIFDKFNQISHEGYYVKMAVAWAIAECLAKFPDETVDFLKQNNLDDFTQNKAIQKSRESFRIESKLKEELKSYKR